MNHDSFFLTLSRLNRPIGRFPKTWPATENAPACKKFLTAKLMPIVAQIDSFANVDCFCSK
jgi:hypothetical protein